MKSFKDVQSRIIHKLEAKKAGLKQEMNATIGQSKSLEKNLNDLATRLSKIGEKQGELSTLLLQWVLPIFALSTILLFLTPRVYRSDITRQAIFSSGVLLEVTTVFLLIGTVLILGLGGKIQGDILGTLLGGISGYVLGRSARASKPEK